MQGSRRIQTKVGGQRRTQDDVLSRHVEHKLVEIKEEKERAKHRASAAE
jgi:hypothetical protein